MRDGIPRGMPVPRKWQRVVECADRPADRGTERVGLRLQEAIRDDLRREFPNETKSSLKKLLRSAEGVLPGFEFAGVPAGGAARCRDHQVSEVLADVQAAVEEGTSLEAALRDAIAARVEAIAVARRRQITEDLAGKVRPNELARVMKELDRAITSINPRFEAEQFLEALSFSADVSDQRISADEDLRRHRQ